MRVLIVEDETAAYENMADALRTIDPAIEIAGNTESVSQTLEWLQTHPQPDLIFMDIHLSDGSAFLLFDRMKIETPVVFTTAYDQYALALHPGEQAVHHRPRQRPRNRRLVRQPPARETDHRHARTDLHQQEPGDGVQGMDGGRVN